MTTKRFETILSSLQAGHWIFVSWRGSQRSGSLVYHLKGVNRLRASEVDELRHDGIIRAMRPNDAPPAGGLTFRGYQWKPYCLREASEIKDRAVATVTAWIAIDATELVTDHPIAPRLIHSLIENQAANALEAVITSALNGTSLPRYLCGSCRDVRCGGETVCAQRGDPEQETRARTPRRVAEALAKLASIRKVVEKHGGAAKGILA